MATLQRKTVSKFLRIKGIAEIAARPSADLSSHRNLPAYSDLFSDYHLVHKRITPALTLEIPGVGSLYLAPNEVDALRTALGIAADKCVYPRAYDTARTLVVPFSTPPRRGE